MITIEKSYKKAIFPTIYFIVVLLIIHVLWRAGIFEDTDLSGRKIITCFGYEVTAFFNFFISVLVSAVNVILSMFSSVVYEVHGNAFTFAESSETIEVVWSCTGLKQAIFFLVLILCYPKQSIHKLWYIPVGLIVIFIINIIRISGIIGLCSVDMARFETLHELSKYVFYVILFGMWILWDWKVANLHK